MNRRLRNRKARRERKRLAAQYDAVSASLAEATRKNEERFEEAIRRRAGSGRGITTQAGSHEQRRIRRIFTHPWLYAAFSLVCGTNFFIGVVTNAISDGDSGLRPLAWFLGVFVFQGMGEVAEEYRIERRRAG